MNDKRKIWILAIMVVLVIFLSARSVKAKEKLIFEEAFFAELVPLWEDEDIKG